jgi:dimethylglycine dehydrogenase
MKSHARVVVVGGGVMGVGLLYHLAVGGWSDVVLVEKAELTSGSTWHAAGQCPLFNGSLNMTKVHQYGTELYPRLGALTGHHVSWHACGGLRLATTDEEVLWLKHILGISRLAGYEAHIVGPREIADLHPYLDTFGVKAAFLTVSDGHVAPADVTLAMAAGARQLGAEVYRRTRVTDIQHLPSGEWQVITEAGNIVCEHVVNSAGSYCDVVAAWTGHRAPISNLLHHYVITEPLQQLRDLDKELPVVRDPFSNCYLREEGHGILVGPYETSTAHSCWQDRPPPWDFESELLAPELERLMPWLEKAAQRLPLFAGAGVKSAIAGAITHTPDGVYLSGPAPGPRNYWMHCGASIGICQGAGAGKYLAQWMMNGQAEINMREFDPRRFGSWTTPQYTRAAALEDYRRMYYCYKPGEQHETGRGLRKSAFYDVLAREGAQFEQTFGWERPRWFDRNGTAPEQFSWQRSNWWHAVEQEALAVRERVGLADLSAFSKFEVSGPDAQAFLARICANKIPPRDGGIVLTHLLTPAGFIESELTVTRLLHDHYYLLSAAVAELHDLDQLLWRRLPHERVSIVDVTEQLGVLVLAGPRAREVLRRTTTLDVGNAAFPWLTCRIAPVAGAPNVRLLRINYVGELGWELHLPMAQMAHVGDALLMAGARYGIRLFGSYAMNSLRLEKAYRSWGAELTNEVTMIEADMRRFLDFSKDFIGKAATLDSQSRGPRTRLTYLQVDAADADCLGNEPVFCGDRLVGITTSGAYGFAVRKSLAFAYVDPTLVDRAADPDARDLQISIRGENRAARIVEQPAWDPRNERLRA